MDDDDVTKLPVAYKAPPDGSRMLQPVNVPFGACRHQRVTFEVDVDGGKCKCLGCGTEVTPFFVLEELMHKESQWNRSREAYIDEMKRLGERSRTKCRHCGQMTEISRR